MVGGQRFGHFRYFSGILLAASLGLSACESLRTEGPGEIGGTQSQARSRLTGEGGGTLLSLGGRNSGTPQGATLGVNGFLWRASLDTIAFMPLASADPFGGVIITDWYTPVETPNERMKVQVTILDRELRADGVRVSVFKQQTAPKGGNWVDAQVDPRTQIDIENAILTRARQLRIAGGS